MKIGLGAIRKDKEILIFPLLSIVFSGLLFSGLIFGTFFTAGIEGFLSPFFWVSLFLIYLVICVLIVYFNVAVIGCAMIRFKGGDPVVRDGFRTANQNITAILKWAALSAVVGVILEILERKVKVLGSMAKFAWGVATCFVIPVLIFEKVSISQAISRSTDILRKTWGEMVVGGLGLGLIAVLIWFFPTLAVAVVWEAVGRPFGLIIPLSAVLIWGMVVGCIYTAARSALVAALYTYATTKEVPSGFSKESITNPWDM